MNEALKKTVLISTLCVFCAAGASAEAFLYEDGFEQRDGALNGAPTAEPFGRWKADEGLVVSSGVMKAASVGVYDAAIPLPELSENSVVRLEMRLRLWRAPGKDDTGFAFGFTPFYPTRLYGEGSAFMILQSMTGQLQVYSGKGLLNRLTRGWLNPWDSFEPEKRFNVVYEYRVKDGTMTLELSQGEERHRVFDGKKLDWMAPGIAVPVEEMRHLVFMFNKQAVSGASGYIDHMRVEVYEP